MLILSSTVYSAEEITRSCAPATETDIAKLLDRWNASLQTKNPDSVVANYATDVMLLPTVSNTPRTNHMEIRDYFVHFLAKDPVGRIDKRMIKISCNTALDAGVYTFALKNKGKVEKVPARYTYYYEFRDGK